MPRQWWQGDAGHSSQMNVRTSYMQITELTEDGLKRAMTVVIPAADIDGAVQSRLKKIAETARLPGFRPGKAPLSLLKKRFGSAVLGEVLEETIGQSSQKALSDNGIRPAMQPKIEVRSFDEGKDLEYRIEAEILPEIGPVDCSGIELERWVVEVGDEDTDATLERLRKEARSLKPLEEPRPAQAGDVAVVDFVGRIDDVAFDGGSAEDQRLDLGSGQFVPGFEEQVIGMSAGDRNDVTVTFPAEYPAKEVAGKTAIFDVTLKEVLVPELPELNDELAANFGMENLEALRKTIGERIQRDFSAFSRARLKRQILDKLADSHDFAVPESLVNAEFDTIWKQIEADREAGRLDAEDAGKAEEDLRTEYRAIAERRVRLGLLLAEVGRANNITVTQDELNRAVFDYARRFPGQEREVLEYFQKNKEQMNNFRGPVLEEKVIDFIIEMAKVSEKTVTKEELTAPIDGAPETTD